jgi:hypothetical protein
MMINQGRLCLIVVLAFLAGVTHSFSINTKWLRSKVIAPAVIATGLLSGGVGSALASDISSPPNRDVYFGVGCFWHVMHEFVQTEQNVLGRGSKQITSAAGYGGSNRVGKNTNRPDDKQGVVCYHNLMGVGDYGKLGYGEVVGMELPDSSEGESVVFRAFAKEYFSLFKNGDRPDQGDRGLEYRSLIGLPGGVKSPMYAVLQEEAAKVPGGGLKLLEGRGGDADTSGKRTVWVYVLCSVLSFLPSFLFLLFVMFVSISLGLLLLPACILRHHMTRV